MTLLSINDFDEEEKKELEIFAQAHMQDTCSATNGDSLRMAFSLLGINKTNEKIYYDNSDLINKSINTIYKNYSSILDN